VDAIVLSSTHRLAERISEKLHEAYKAARPGVKLAQITAFKVKQLQPRLLQHFTCSDENEVIRQALVWCDENS
jgi:methionine aminopeptidase